MYPNDETRLYHMRDSAAEALAFVEGRTRGDLESDRQLVLALAKSIEIIGEAASNVSEEFIARHPEIPWPQIRGMRNRLIHAYFDVDLDVLWDTVTHDLPPLLATLQRIISSDYSS